MNRLPLPGKLYHKASFLKQLKLLIRQGISPGTALEHCYELARDDWRTGCAPLSMSTNPRMPSWLDAPQRSMKKDAMKKAKKIPHRAKELFESFTGHEANESIVIDISPMPSTLVAIGEVLGIIYQTRRDGNLEKYIHQFKARARPLLGISPDGKSAHLIGGSFEFGERGFVDNP